MDDKNIFLTIPNGLQLWARFQRKPIMKSLKSIAKEINDLSSNYRMGQFQEIRRKILGLSRVKTNEIFTDQTIHDKWAFHSGGRKELQFNIGFEGDENEWFRYGVAFSLEPSKTLPDPLILKPKILKLNQYLEKNLTGLDDLRFWYYSLFGRSQTLPVQPVSEDLIKIHTFLFWGKLSPRDEVNYKEVLFLFDRLVTLYEYVEGNAPLRKVDIDLRKGFQFKPGFSSGVESAIGFSIGGTRTIQLRHRKLQKALHYVLSAQYGENNVGGENDTGRGSRIDLVVREGNKHIYYEIKAYPCIRTCLREALSQLMEYSYWPGGNSCERMIVVSENPITPDAKRYLDTLRNTFHLPVFYQQFDLENKSLGSTQ